jgi:type IV pilus assembly protein PilV
MLRPKSNPATFLQSGFSLMEVLVAVFVLAVGITGIAGLQFTAKRSNFEAIQRATAVMLATDLVERMRANSGQLLSYNASGNGTTLSGVPAATITPNCSTAVCTPAQLAAYDLWEFHRALVGVTEQSGGANVGGLSLPMACITGPVPLAGPASAPGDYTVTLAWRGLTQLPDPAGVSTCGQASGNYNDPETGETDVYRRVLVLQTFLDIWGS